VRITAKYLKPATQYRNLSGRLMKYWRELNKISHTIQREWRVTGDD
jgi:hypothetical protein